MKLLITGVGGFAAGNVAEWLGNHAGYEIVGTYRHHEPDLPLSECVPCDLYSNPDIIGNLEFDAVAHFASQTQDGDIRLFLDNTVQATRNLIDIAVQKKVKKFIYISTVSVLGETNGIVNEASDCINPTDYGMAKRLGERLLEASEIEEKIIIRLPKVLGKDIDFTSPWLPKVSYAMMQNEDVSYYNPELKYNAVLHTDDLAQFINDLLKDQRNMGGTYMLGSEDAMSIIDILYYLREQLHSRSKLTEIEPKAPNRCYLIDISQAKKAGFRPDIVRNVIKKYVEQNCFISSAF